MPVDPPISQSNRIAAVFRRDTQRLQQRAPASAAPRMVVGSDSERESRLRGLFDGLFATVGDCTAMENRVGELRQACRNPAAFRQALFLLGRVHGLDATTRAELVRRAMAWWRARGLADGSLATPWAKSMVLVARGQAGKLQQ